MAKTNYTFEKRQKELAKKKKQEEKRQKKIASKDGEPSGETFPDESAQPPADETTPV